MKSLWNRDGESSAKAEKGRKVVKVRRRRMTYQEKQEWAEARWCVKPWKIVIAAIEEKMQANGSDFGKLASLKKEWKR